ncbi:MAG: sugar kinase [Proteobacteria bacterium]|nr:sugar kinase [Pseudomonadota bacterium]
MSSIVAVGSLAFDSIETPFGSVGKILGGSANHFSLSASYFSPVKCISVVGEDYPKDHLDYLKSKNIDLSGVTVSEGKTFHWSGRYGYDLHEATTLDTQLNVFEHFSPEVPLSYQDSPFLFLGNILPSLQDKVLKNLPNAKFIALDTMNFWIQSQKEALIQVLSKVHCLIINEAELRQLTQTHNVVKAAEMVRNWGPHIVVVKRGEYGALLFNKTEAFSLPGLPLSEVKDPTGAGDSFAGGFLGYLASCGQTSPDKKALRQAVVFGSVMASFIVEDFGCNQLLRISKEQIDKRFQHFKELTSFN